MLPQTPSAFEKANVFFSRIASSKHIVPQAEVVNIFLGRYTLSKAIRLGDVPAWSYSLRPKFLLKNILTYVFGKRGEQRGFACRVMWGTK